MKIVAAALSLLLALATGASASPTRHATPQLWVFPTLELRYLDLNRQPGRPFADPQLRIAASYAIDRRALAIAAMRTEGAYALQPVDTLLPPTMPGYVDEHVYPLFVTAEALVRARSLAAAHRGERVRMCTRAGPTGPSLEAQTVAYDLAQIGLQVEFVPTHFCSDRDDIAVGGVAPEYPEPGLVLSELIRQSRFAQELTAGPGAIARRESAGRLAIRLALDNPPVIATATVNHRVFLSARVGCVTHSLVYGLDLAALCLRGTSPRG